MSYSPAPLPVQKWSMTLSAGTTTIAGGGHTYIVGPNPVAQIPADADPEQDSYIYWMLGIQLKMVQFSYTDTWNISIYPVNNVPATISGSPFATISGTAWPSPPYTAKTMYADGSTTGNLPAPINVATTAMPISLRLEIDDTGSGGTFSWTAMIAYALVIPHV